MSGAREQRGAVARGIATAHSALPLRERMRAGEMPSVWPHPEGDLRGEALLPIYKTAPDAARKDPALHELLALFDALRAGRARNLAAAELRERIERAAV